MIIWSNFNTKKRLDLNENETSILILYILGRHTKRQKKYYSIYLFTAGQFRIVIQVHLVGLYTFAYLTKEKLLKMDYFDGFFQKHGRGVGVGYISQNELVLPKKKTPPNCSKNQ